MQTALKETVKWLHEDAVRTRLPALRFAQLQGDASVVCRIELPRDRKGKELLKAVKHLDSTITRQVQNVLRAIE